MEGSLFAPQRTLGLVCSPFPFVLHTEGQLTFLSLPLNNTFQTYYTDHLKIRYIGPPLSRTVNSVAAYKDLILVASGPLISGWHKVKQVKTYTGSKSTIAELFVFGEFVLAINFGAEVVVWNADSQEMVGTLPLPGQGVCFAHPPTYLNKVLIATKRLLTLYNIKTSTAVYDYPVLRSRLHSDITCLDPAPALDLVGIGLSDGTVLIWNVKTDEYVLELKQESAVTALSFCTTTEEVLATSDDRGVVYLWNLPERRLQATVVAHPGFKVDKVQFLPQEPVFVSSSGGQNSLKEYIIEEGQPRLLRERNGFATPPIKLAFYDDRHILAISEKQIRDLSLLNEHQSCDLSYKLIQKVIQRTTVSSGLRPFRSFASAANREKDWTNILTCHFGTPVPLLWSYENKTLGHKPVELKNSNSEVTCVEVSHCGTFGIAGLLSGKIEKFTMQSGMHFVEFDGQHEGQVTGVKTDMLNRVLVSSGADGVLKFWSFPTGRLITEVNVGEAILEITLDRNSFLVAVASSTHVRIYDVRTYSLAREFSVDYPTSLAFSSESRWLAITSGAYLYLWDIPSSRLLDWVQFDSDPVSVAFSPVGNYLATCHKASLGVFLWRNRAFAETVIIESAPTEARLMKGFDVAHGKDFYTTKPVDFDSILSVQTEKPSVEMQSDALPEAPEHHDVSLSALPISRVMAISEIEEIKERNRPMEPAKKENVPFFLPDSMNIVKVREESEEEKKSHILRNDPAVSDLSQLLNLPAASILEHLKTESPSKLDLDILQLTTTKELSLMLSFFQHCLASKKDYDFVQSLLHCFLKVHGAALSTECKTELQELKATQEKLWKALDEEFMRDVSGLARAAGVVT